MSEHEERLSIGPIGISVTDLEEARDGAGGSKVVFVHPKDTGGVLFELTQTDDEERRD